jgi:WD40 repeat protein
MTTWEVVAEIPHATSAIAWSPDGTQIAVAASWDVEIWDVAELIEAYQYLP